MQYLTKRMPMLVLAAIFCGDAAAQAGAPAPAAVAPAPEGGNARVRLFGQNGVTVRFYEDSACFGGHAKETQVSGGMKDAFSSFLGRVDNTSIGMPATPTTLGIKQRDGAFSKAYFKEYQLAAGRPLTVWMHFQSNPGPAYTACGAIGGTFTPAAGKDYEVTLDLADGQCLATVREIGAAADGSVQLARVQVAPAAECN